MKRKGILKSVSALVASVVAAGVFAFVPGGFTVRALEGGPINSDTGLPTDSGTYYLTSDISVTTDMRYSGAGTNITIDLNGFSIIQNGSSSTRVFTVENQAKLTIRDTAGGGRIVGSGAGASLSSGVSSPQSGGGIIYVGGKYQNDGADPSLTVFTLEGGTLCNGTAVQHGGGVLVYHGTFNMSGGTISNCYAQEGGGVSVRDSAVFNFSGGSIEDNTATHYGGGIRMVSGIMNLSGGTVTRNVCTCENTSNGCGGGGIMNYGGKVNISGNPVVTGNSSSNNDRDNLTLYNSNTNDAGKIYITGDIGPEACIGLSYYNSPNDTRPIVGSNSTGTIGANGVLYSDMSNYQLVLGTDGRVTLGEPGHQITAHIAGHSLSLSGNIGVNYYMTLADEIIANPNDYVMTFTVGGEVRNTVSVAQATKQGEYYIFPVEVVAKEMTTAITAHFENTATGVAVDLNGAAEGTDDTYTVRDYAASILTGSDYAQKTKDLVTAMIYYGAMAQTHLGYTGGDGAANVIGETTYTPSLPSMSSVPALTGDTSSTDASVASFYGVGMILRSQPVIRLYFAVDPEASGLTFKVNGSAVETHAAGTGYCYIDIPNLAPKDFSNNYSISVSQGSNPLISFDYSARNYFRSAYDNNGAGSSWGNLAQAMEAYYQAANAY